MHVGLSEKTEKRELFSAECDLLTDEKKHHDDCRAYRRTRRNRLRYRAPRFMNLVRWKIVDVLREKLPGVTVSHTYGAETSRTRKDLGLEKKSC